MKLYNPQTLGSLNPNHSVQHPTQAPGPHEPSSEQYGLGDIDRASWEVSTDVEAVGYTIHQW